MPQVHSAHLSELQERLFWQEQNNPSVAFVGLWTVEILREQLLRRKQCFKLSGFFLPLGDLSAKIWEVGIFFCPCHVINHSTIIPLPAVYLSNYGIDLTRSHHVWVSQVIKLFIFTLFLSEMSLCHPINRRPGYRIEGMISTAKGYSRAGI